MLVDDISFMFVSAMFATLSLITVKMPKWFVGIGICLTAFGLLSLATKSPELSLFSGIGTGILFSYFYEKAILNDNIYLALLLVAVSFLGIILTSTFLNELRNLHIVLPDIDRGINPLSFFKEIISFYKKFIYAIKHFSNMKGAMLCG